MCTGLAPIQQQFYVAPAMQHVAIKQRCCHFGRYSKGAAYRIYPFRVARNYSVVDLLGSRQGQGSIVAIVKSLGLISR